MPYITATGKWTLGLLAVPNCLPVPRPPGQSPRFVDQIAADYLIANGFAVEYVPGETPPLPEPEGEGIQMMVGAASSGDSGSSSNSLEDWQFYALSFFNDKQNDSAAIVAATGISNTKANAIVGARPVDWEWVTVTLTANQLSSVTTWAQAAVAAAADGESGT